MRNSQRPRGTEKINATRRLQLEWNSKTIACQLKIIEGYGEGDRKQRKRLGPWTNQDMDNGGWHYKRGFERKPEGKEAESAHPEEEGGEAVWRPACLPAHPGSSLRPSLQVLPPAAQRGQIWVSPVTPVFLKRGLWGLLESDLARATRLPAGQLLPLIPGTSGLKIAVKVTLVYREKNVEVYILDMKK